MSESTSEKPNVKRVTRIFRIFQLRAKGYSVPAISRQLKSEGYKSGFSESTIWRDIASDEYKRLRDQLVIDQLADIEIADLNTRLRFRDKMIERLFPTQIEEKHSWEPTGFELWDQKEHEDEKPTSVEESSPNDPDTV